MILLARHWFYWRGTGRAEPGYFYAAKKRGLWRLLWYHKRGTGRAEPGYFYAAKKRGFWRLLLY